MKHAAGVAYEGGLPRLAEDLGNLRYDALESFLRLLSAKLARDAEADLARGRPKLAAALAAAAGEIAAAWEVSAPHMRGAEESP